VLDYQTDIQLQKAILEIAKEANINLKELQNTRYSQNEKSFAFC